MRPAVANEFAAPASRPQLLKFNQFQCRFYPGGDQAYRRAFSNYCSVFWMNVVTMGPFQARVSYQPCSRVLKQTR
jgi:hypothetical protein